MSTRLNLGCADLPLAGYINIDLSTSPHIKSDVTADALALAFAPESVDEIWAAHLVEHLTPLEAEAAIAHWKELLKPGGTLAIVTPDFRALCEHYLSGDVSLGRLNDEFIYSYCQESHHACMYDQDSLFELLAQQGFHNLKAVDRFNDPRLFYKDSLQCGAVGQK